MQYNTYISVHPPVHPRADKSDKLIASLVDNKAAHLALVTLLSKPPEIKHFKLLKASLMILNVY